ncbi:hypothetical protein BDV32DRAFT_142196 [Aspergillus pseudonomiae]|nr:hypothetical protein BDV32DRAFT_142196 [Aspergillus pseudonomiae]
MFGLGSASVKKFNPIVRNYRPSSIINAKDEIGRWVPQLKGKAKVNPLVTKVRGHQPRLRRLSFCGQRHGNHPEPKVRRQDPPSESTLIILNQFHYPALAALVRRRPA